MIVPADIEDDTGGVTRPARIAPGVTCTRRRAIGSMVGAFGLWFAGCRSATVANGEQGIGAQGIGLEQLLMQLRPRARELLALPGGGSAAQEEDYLRLVANCMSQLRPESEWTHDRDRPITMAARAYVPPMMLYELVLAPGARLELHDHRDYDGVLATIEGQVAVDSYHYATASGGHRSVLGSGVPTEASFLVRRTARQQLQRGDCASLARDRDNLHELVAGPAGCRLLDCFTHFRDGAGSHELVLEPVPVDAASGLFRAAWKG
ncbi:MAG: hypothetical protein MUC36_22225 [Planctomycetes bacterium]|jgi:hypothetical protein|nr:hypothetical protein [Planctomycetota bacterium]